MPEEDKSIAIDWHSLTENETLEKLEVSSHGLKLSQVSDRLRIHGFNEIVAKKKDTPLKILLRQFNNFMIIILIITAIVSGILGDLTDTVVILMIVVLNAILGFVQEFRAEKAIDALKKMASFSACVVRESQTVFIPSAELVPGDVVLLEAGNVIPADMRIIESSLVRAEEASLTGESNPVEKQTQSIFGINIPLGDRTNMLFKGTSVVHGRGKGVVVATGLKTELGKIALLLQENDVMTPLQKRLLQFSKNLAYGILLICLAVFIIGILQKKDLVLMLVTSLSLAVAAIPESLPAVITIALALGVKKMVKQNVLIRKLPVVETLGSVTYICTDKTGTLTQNKMKVVEIMTEAYRGTVADLHLKSRTPELNELFVAMALNGDVIEDKQGDPKGDPTELALYEMALLHGFRKNETTLEFPRIAEIPFDAVRKCMTTLHKNGSAYMAITKGAPEVLLDPLKVGHPGMYVEEAEKMTSEGLRVIAFASRDFEKMPDDISPAALEKDWKILGMAGIMDPPRHEVEEAIARCKTAGIVPVLITGDHVNTARTIARKLGILVDEGDKVMTGHQLSEINDKDFELVAERVKVYARVSPEQKQKIVKALQQRGQIVAMTGDGVNDAPALKSADIGIAMGIAGTDVSKEAAHMILLDDNFASIVKAVSRGRRIYDNIRSFIRFVLTGNSAEIWTIFLAPLMGLPMPLLPIHILWINLITDGLPGLALAAEPARPLIMARPPRRPDESIFSGGMGIHILWMGLLMGAITLGMQAISLYEGYSHWQTMVFVQLSFVQLIYAIAVRSDTESIFTIGFFTNKPLIGAVLIAAFFQLATVYIPFLNPVFKTEPLSFKELTIVLVLSTSVFFVVEVEKLIKRRMSRS